MQFPILTLKGATVSASGSDTVPTQGMACAVTFTGPVAAQLWLRSIGYEPVSAGNWVPSFVGPKFAATRRTYERALQAQ